MPSYMDQNLQPGEGVEYRGRISRAVVAKGPNTHPPTLIVAMSAAALALMLAGCGGGSTQVSAAKFCADASATFSTIQSLTSNNLAPPGKSDLTSAAAQIQKLVDEAPAQIKADLTTERTFLEKATINGIGAVDSATTTAENAAVGRLNAYAAQNCGSGNTNVATASSSPSTAAESLTAFCQDRPTVIGEVSTLTSSQSGISASALQQDISDAQRLADEAPPQFQEEAAGIASDLQAIARAPNDPNAAPSLLPHEAALSTDSLNCPGGSNYSGVPSAATT